MTVTSSPHDHIVILVNLTCRIRLSSFINLINLSNIKTLIIRISITKILLIILYTIFNYYHNQNINNNAQFYTLYDINFIIF